MLFTSLTVSPTFPTDLSFHLFIRVERASDIGNISVHYLDTGPYSMFKSEHYSNSLIVLSQFLGYLRFEWTAICIEYDIWVTMFGRPFRRGYSL